MAQASPPSSGQVRERRKTDGKNPYAVLPAGYRVGVDSDRAMAPGRASDQSHVNTSGDVRTAISDGLVALLKEYYDRGPEKTKTYVHDDLVVCLLRGGFTRVEQTLLEGGHGDDVIRQRMVFQDVMRERFGTSSSRPPAARSSASCPAISRTRT
jgi:hypothetical protein